MDAYEIEEKTSDWATKGCAVIALLIVVFTLAATCNWINSF